MWSKSLAAVALIASANAAATFPSNIDEIEDLLFLQDGYRAKGFASIVTPCTNEAYSGFNNAAGLIRTGFHDIAAHDQDAGTDGLDASVGMELAGDYSDKNAGPSFYADMIYFAQFFNSKASMADLLALGIVNAVKSCAGPDIALRAGRIDATSGGAVPALPDPAESAEKLTGRFSKMGFSPQEMIQLVACGHTIGAVHKGVSGALDPTDPNSINQAGAQGQFQFDHTPTTFDNGIATDFCSANKNGLDFGDSIDQLVRDEVTGRNSDTKVFQVDKPDDQPFGATIQSMADSNDAFLGQCQKVLEKMINLVPNGVVLSDIIQPYDVKPVQVDLNVQPDGTIGVFAEIRVRDGAISGGVANIQLVYTGDDGDACQGDCTIHSTGTTNTASGNGESFTFYQFSGVVSSISSYKVSINGNLFDNNGAGYPINDFAFIQTASSTANGGQIELVVAVRGSGSPSITISEKQGLDESGKLQFNTLPTIKKSSPSLSKSCSGSKFSFYTASFTVSDPNTAKLDLSLGGKIVDAFRNVLFGSSAAEFSCIQKTSTTSSTASSTTSSASTSSSLTTTTESTTESTTASTTTSATTASTSSNSGSTTTSADGSTSSSSGSVDATTSTTSGTAKGSTTSGTSSGTGKATGTSSLTTTTGKASSLSTTTSSNGGKGTTSASTSGSASSSTGKASSTTGKGSSTGKGTDASTKTTSSGGSKGSSSSSKNGGNAWQQWTQAGTTTKTTPAITPTCIVPTKPNHGAFNDAVSSIAEKLKKKPAKGVYDVEQNVPGLNLHVPVPTTKPTITVTTAVYTQTIVYVSWNSPPTPTGKSGNPSATNGATWAAASSWSAAQQSAAPAQTWQTWVSPSATATGTNPVKAFAGSASTLNAGGFLFTAVGVLAAAILL